MTVRYWLLTSTTYGTWLPGDDRGFVSRVRDDSGPRTCHNQPGTPYDRDVAGLRHSARARLKCPPIRLTAEQAAAVLTQFRETANYRGWTILAAAVMGNHFHLVVAAPPDVHSTAILRDFKSYAARALNRQWQKPASGTWWTESGSRRALPDERAVQAAVDYVRNQPGALAVWTIEDSPSGGVSPPSARVLGGLTPPARNRINSSRREDHCTWHTNILLAF